MNRSLGSTSRPDQTKAKAFLVEPTIWKEYQKPQNDLRPVYRDLCEALRELGVGPLSRTSILSSFLLEGGPRAARKRHLRSYQVGAGAVRGNILGHHHSSMGAGVPGNDLAPVVHKVRRVRFYQLYLPNIKVLVKVDKRPTPDPFDVMQLKAGCGKCYAGFSLRAQFGRQVLPRPLPLHEEALTIQDVTSNRAG